MLYEMLVQCHLMKADRCEMKILSFDMGKTYSGWSLIDNNGIIYRSGLIQHPVDCMIFPTFNQQVSEFSNEIREILSFADLKSDSNDCIVFERLMTRPGRGMGGVIEVCNFMLGIINKLSNVAMIPVCACTWKNFYKKKYETNVSADLLAYMNLKTMHECDSILIGCHHLIKNQNVEDDIHTKLKLADYYISIGEVKHKSAKKKKTKKKVKKEKVQLKV